MKQLFLYDVYSKTQGMAEEIQVLEGYLEKVSRVQTQINGSVPVRVLV